MKLDKKEQWATRGTEFEKISKTRKMASRRSGWRVLQYALLLALSQTLFAKTLKPCFALLSSLISKTSAESTNLLPLAHPIGTKGGSEEASQASASGTAATQVNNPTGSAPQSTTPRRRRRLRRLFGRETESQTVQSTSSGPATASQKLNLTKHVFGCDWKWIQPLESWRRKNSKYPLFGGASQPATAAQQASSSPHVTDDAPSPTHQEVQVDVEFPIDGDGSGVIPLQNLAQQLPEPENSTNGDDLVRSGILEEGVDVQGRSWASV